MRAVKDFEVAGKTILVADDDADDCLLIKDALADIGLKCELRFVADGIELMEHLEKCQRLQDRCRLPDLIVLDLNMPRKGGREALKEISVHPVLSKLHIIVLTTSEEPRDIALCRSFGAKLFITKPSVYGEWLEKLEGFKDFL